MSTQIDFVTPEPAPSAPRDAEAPRRRAPPRGTPPAPRREQLDLFASPTHPTERSPDDRES